MVLKQIAGKGPISLSVPASAAEEKSRIERMGNLFYFYRKDRDVKDMTFPRAVRSTNADKRRDVLAVGTGADVTSYSPNSRVYMGKHWEPGSTTLASDIDVIELANGRDGVGAIKVPFHDLRPGQTIVISGGAMNGCTMLFAADKSGLYAYHAGTSSLNSSWHTSSDGASSIVDAHETMGTASRVPYAWQHNNHDLIVMGRQYPFSALIYSAKPLAQTHALTGAGGMVGAIANAQDTVPNADLNVPRHAFSPRVGKDEKPPARRWQMMTFNYHEDDPTQRSVGTAEAVITKEAYGAVTVHVLAERGVLDRRTSLGERGDALAYRYKTTESDSDSWFVPVPTR